ncbi:WYL domain-containing protein [Pseudomonas sp. BP6]|uniref:WYL domain-containing protein n=1 Tax=unclassified Pseudomonas TaxID=196821 RepID=UPI0032AF924D
MCPQLTQDRHGWVLTCQLKDSLGLRLFLLSNAAGIEVLAPSELREYVCEKLHEALERYKRPAD